MFLEQLQCSFLSILAKELCDWQSDKYMVIFA